MNPLSQADIDAVNQATTNIAIAEDWIRRLALCGAECQGVASGVGMLKHKLRAFAAQFGADANSVGSLIPPEVIAAGG